MSTPRDDLLVWIDLEMTGLDPFNDQIIEIATIVTGADLEIVAEGPSLAIHQPLSVLERMDEWNQTQHRKSGLYQRVCETRLSTAEAEEATLAFLRPLVQPGSSPMCGNSICQDRRFMARLMPSLQAFFHYRNLDVSTLKELARRWTPERPAFEKSSAHLALDDVRDSIAELKHYRTHLFGL